MKKKVLIIALGTLHNDPRVIRQIDVLKENFEIITAGYSDSHRGVGFIELKQHVLIDYYFSYPLLVRKMFSAFTQLYLRTQNFRQKLFKVVLKCFFLKTPGIYFRMEYWNRVRKKNFEQLRDVNPDVILANDLHTLPIAVRLKSDRVKLVFDAHEYYPGEIEESVDWMKNRRPAVDYLCKKYLSFVDTMFTVSAAIGREYAKNFKVNPVIVTNAAKFQTLSPHSVTSTIKLIHHGAAMAGRLLEETINVIEHLESNYTLDLMLLPTDVSYLTSLKEKYRYNKRISFVEPVPTEKICETINKYDIGVYILPALNFNNTNALPNKFFEFIQARLAIAIAPMPAMAEIVNDYKLGVVSADYSSVSLANAIQSLSRENILECKMNSNRAAKELSSEENNKIVLSEIKKLTSA